jgi:hypothetical protein
VKKLQLPNIYKNKTEQKHGNGHRERKRGHIFHQYIGFFFNFLTWQGSWESKECDYYTHRGTKNRKRDRRADADGRGVPRAGEPQDKKTKRESEARSPSLSLFVFLVPRALGLDTLTSFWPSDEPVLQRR